MTLLQKGFARFSERGPSFDCAVILDEFDNVKTATGIIYFSDDGPKFSKTWFALDLISGPLTYMQV